MIPKARDHSLAPGCWSSTLDCWGRPFSSSHGSRSSSSGGARSSNNEARHARGGGTGRGSAEERGGVAAGNEGAAERAQRRAAAARPLESAAEEESPGEGSQGRPTQQALHQANRAPPARRCALTSTQACRPADNRSAGEGEEGGSTRNTDEGGEAAARLPPEVLPTAADSEAGEHSAPPSAAGNPSQGRHWAEGWEDAGPLRCARCDAVGGPGGHHACPGETDADALTVRCPACQARLALDAEDGTAGEAVAAHREECERELPDLWRWAPRRAGGAPNEEGSDSDEEEGGTAPPTAGDASQRALWEEGWVAALLEALREADSLEEARWYLPTFRNVPRPANAGWADAVKALGDAVGQRPADEEAWKGWSLLSRLLLWVPTRQRGVEMPPANKAEVVLRRLSRLFAGEAAALLQEARAAAQEHAKQRRASSPQDPDDPAAVAEAACRQAAAGSAG